MTQAELEAFLAVVRCGTVSGAAQQLFITQPALSRRLGVLEEELGYPLLQRGRGRRSGERPYMAVVDRIEGLDIDYPEDFAMAEIIAASRNQPG